MTALKMTADEALALADQWCAGLTMDADSKGWGAILLVLAEEVRRLRMELAHEEQRVADMMADVNRVGHEIERLRADARRYRWLRDVAATTTDSEPVVCSSTPNDRECLFGDGLDAAIDAAMEASNAG